MNVLTLYNSIIQESPGVLVQIGRKAAHLISHYKINLEEQSFLTCLYRTYSSEITETKPPIPKGYPLILISDSIHTGNEMKEVLKVLKPEQQDIKKVFCYLLNNEGLKKLLSEGLIDKGKIIYLFSSFSEDEYYKESSKLQVFYRNRIEPMDPDVSFNKYNVNTILTTDMLFEILTPLKEYVSDGDVSIEVSEDRGLSLNVKELLCTIYECKILQDMLEETFLSDYDSEINGVSIRFKINQKTIDSEFTVIVKGEGSCKPKEILDYTHCVEKEDLCVLTKVSFDPKKEDEAKMNLCPRCLDFWFTNHLLNFIDQHIKKEVTNKGFVCTLIRSYRPFG